MGQKISGTVIHHIEDIEKPDHVVGLLVSIVENQVNGLVPKTELPRQEFIPLYRVGAEVLVEITSITKKGLRLRISE